MFAGPGCACCCPLPAHDCPLLWVGIPLPWHACRQSQQRPPWQAAFANNASAALALSALPVQLLIVGDFNIPAEPRDIHPSLGPYEESYGEEERAALAGLMAAYPGRLCGHTWLLIWHATVAGIERHSWPVARLLMFGRQMMLGAVPTQQACLPLPLRRCVAAAAP